MKKVAEIECHEYDVIYEEYKIYNQGKNDGITFFQFVMGITERCRFGLMTEYLTLRPEIYRFINLRDGGSDADVFRYRSIETLE